MTEWISVSEAAALTGYHTVTVRDLIREGKVKARKIVTVWQVDAASLRAYVRKQEQIGERRGPKKKGG